MGGDFCGAQVAVVALGGQEILIQNLQLKSPAGNEAAERHQSAQHNPGPQPEMG